MRFIALVVAVFLCLCDAYALEVRVGRHDAYDRIVFDWDAKFSYTFNQSDRDVRLQFEGQDSAEEASVPSYALKRIGNFKKQSTSPLVFGFTVPEGAEVKHYVLSENRLVVDVYNGKKEEVPPANVEEEEVEPISEPVPKVKPEPVEEKKEEAKVAEVVPAPSPKTPDVKPDVEIKEEQPEVVIKEEEKIAVSEEVEAEEAEAKEEEAEEKETEEPEPVQAEPAGDVQEDIAEVKVIAPEEVEQKQPEVVDVPTPLEDFSADRFQAHKVLFSSTEVYGMAAFRFGKTVYFLSDSDVKNVNTSIKANKEPSIRPLSRFALERGHLNFTNIDPSVNIRAQRSGLVWEFLLSESPGAPDAVSLKRSTNENGDVIIIPFKEASEILRFSDDRLGTEYTVVTSKDFKDLTFYPYSFVDFDIVPAYAGAVILPKTDDLQIAKTDKGIEISKPGGLSFLPEDEIEKFQIGAITVPEKRDDYTMILYLEDWILGDESDLDMKKSQIFLDVYNSDVQEKVAGMMRLAKMFLAAAMWPEALSAMDYAEREVPDIARDKTFVAMKGAALSLGKRSEEAMEYLDDKRLSSYEDVAFIRASTLADMNKWEDALAAMPDDVSILQTFTPDILRSIMPMLIETALRNDNPTKAAVLLKLQEQFLDIYAHLNEDAHHYLKGELAEKDGLYSEAEKLWKPVYEGKDDLYSVKAGLALTMMQLENKTLDAGKAIDRLESLRFMWRGDDLETEVNYELGKLYFENGKFLKALTILRDTAVGTDNQEWTSTITQNMRGLFASLFKDNLYEKASPLELATIFEQFSELIPTGEEGSVVVEKVADRLFDADLLDRSAALLQQLVSFRLKGAEVHRVGVKLAATYLLSNTAEEAKRVLAKAIDAYKAAPDEYKTPEKQRELSLLTAQAIANAGEERKALDYLETVSYHPEVNALRADIAWRASLWRQAAYALQDVISDRDIVDKGDLPAEDANTLLQYALALHLSDDQVGLANVRTKYGDVMARSEKARAFEVITRPRQNATLADRDTMMDIIGEVDVFNAFLEGYRK